MPTRTAIYMIAAALAALAPPPASAQIVLPSGSQAKVAVSRIEQIVAYHKQREELVVRAALTAPEGAASVERLAFIIPVPAAPDLVEMEDSRVFSAMRTFELRRADDGAVLPEIAGDYVWTVVSPKQGKPIHDTLNNELNDYGLNTLPNESLKYYDDNAWSFVVLRVSRCAHRNAGTLRPVRIAFESERITFPLKTVRQDSPVSAYLFLITKESLDLSPLEDFGFTLGSPNRVTHKQLPERVDMMLQAFGNHSGIFKELRHGRIFLYSARAEFSADSRMPEWTTEVQVPGPRTSPLGMFLNVLAAAAAVLAVLLLSRPRKKPQDDPDSAKKAD